LEKQTNQLKIQQAEIEIKRAELRDYRKAVAFIKPILAQVGEKKIEVEKYEVSFLECSRWKIDYEAAVAKLEHEEERLKEDFNRKGEREAKIRDLNKTIEINALERDLAKNKNTVD